MQLEAQKYLYDIQQAAARIAEFTFGKQFEDYRTSAMLRAAVERQFEIILVRSCRNWPGSMQLSLSA